jgi:hypothetical protein
MRPCLSAVPPVPKVFEGGTTLQLVQLVPQCICEGGVAFRIIHTNYSLLCRDCRARKSESIRITLSDLDPQQVASRATGHFQPCFPTRRPVTRPVFTSNFDHMSFTVLTGHPVGHPPVTYLPNCVFICSRIKKTSQIEKMSLYLQCLDPP